jgi:hypothetical protein
MSGGGQERGLRSGTVPTPLAVRPPACGLAAMRAPADPQLLVRRLAWAPPVRWLSRRCRETRSM